MDEIIPVKVALYIETYGTGINPDDIITWVGKHCSGDRTVDKYWSKYPPNKLFGVICYFYENKDIILTKLKWGGQLLRDSDGY